MSAFVSAIRRNCLVALAAVVAAVLVGPAGSAEDALSPSSATAERAIELRADLEPYFTGSTEGFERTLPDGTVVGSSDPLPQFVIVARLAPDGRIERLCTRNLDEAVEFLLPAATVAKAPPDDAPSAVTE